MGAGERKCDFGTSDTQGGGGQVKTRKRWQRKEMTEQARNASAARHQRWSAEGTACLLEYRGLNKHREPPKRMDAGRWTHTSGLTHTLRTGSVDATPPGTQIAPSPHLP